MIKKTLYFGNPAYLSLHLDQLMIRVPGGKENHRTIPIEDIGVVVLDEKQITLTQSLLARLMENNCAVIACDSRHLPCGLFLPLAANTVQNERFRMQLAASVPLQKQLWQQTITQKIWNQAQMLLYSTGKRHRNMETWSREVRSGDPDNLEARAAAYYWRNIFPDNPDFIRDREEAAPNALLNYGYGILRAVIARALVSSGLLPTLGIHHHNRYDAYCLADDIMEPYRPYVDGVVVDCLRTDPGGELTPASKVKMLSLPTTEVTIAGKRSPLMVAASLTTASLYKCFEGESRKIVYPEM